MLALPRVSLVMCGEEAVTESLKKFTFTFTQQPARSTDERRVGGIPDAAGGSLFIAISPIPRCQPGAIGHQKDHPVIPLTAFVVFPSYRLCKKSPRERCAHLLSYLLP